MESVSAARFSASVTHLISEKENDAGLHSMRRYFLAKWHQKMLDLSVVSRRPGQLPIITDTSILAAIRVLSY